MTLDDVAALVRSIIERKFSVKFGDPRYTASLNSKELRMLCEAIVVMLPVVRAAESWLSQPGLEWKRSQGSSFGHENHALAKAVDQLRRDLGGTA